MARITNYNSFVNEKVTSKYGYHITRRSNLESIMKEGLTPKVPTDYGMKGDVKGVYFFKTLDDVKNALYNWLGERIEEWEEENDQYYDEVLLKVNLDGLQLIDSVEYEYISIDPISPDKIELADVDFV